MKPESNPRYTGLDSMLTPDNSVLVLIDHQAFQFANVRNMDPTMVINNTVALAKCAKAFKVPTILTTVIENRGGLLLKQLQDVFPEQKPIDRTFINTWEDKNVVDAVKKTGRKKLIMAATGLIGIAFVIGNMTGNLQAFIGKDKLNAYGALLHGPLAELLWLVRVVLIVAVVLHVLMAWQLTMRSRAARPIGYKQREPQVSTWASRTMRWGGVLLLVFIVLHILHFTTGQVDPAHSYARIDAAGRKDVYANLVASFHIWWVAAFYVLVMIFLGLHLYHGAWSSVRTLGYARPSPQPLHRRVALVVAAIVWLGFTIVPLAVVAGIIR